MPLAAIGLGLIVSWTGWWIALTRSDSGIEWLVLTSLAELALWRWFMPSLVVAKRGRDETLHWLMSISLGGFCLATGPFLILFGIPAGESHVEERIFWGLGSGIAFVSIPAAVLSLLCFVAAVLLYRPSLISRQDDES